MNLTDETYQFVPGRVIATIRQGQENEVQFTSVSFALILDGGFETLSAQRLFLFLRVDEAKNTLELEKFLEDVK